VLNCHGKGKED
jgi:hypothetical protein